MATQIVMDHTGDTRHHFDAKDLKALAEAERRFKALTGNGFTAATRQASGDVSLARSFDPNAEGDGVLPSVGWRLTQQWLFG